jgi:hypothetical protein
MFHELGDREFVVAFSFVWPAREFSRTPDILRVLARDVISRHDCIAMVSG